MPIYDRIKRAILELRADITTPVAGPGVSVTQQIGSAYFDELRYGSPSASATAAVQSALGLTRRAFMLGEVTPAQPETELLTPELLAMMAGGMLLGGNAVFEIFESRRGGVTELIPVPAFSVTGSIPRATWAYTLKWRNQADEELEKQVAANRVVHVRYMSNASAPWYGVSPLAAAGVTAEALAYIERSLNHDAQTPVSHVLSVPDQSSDAQRKGVAADIRNARGHIVVEPTTAGGYGTGSQGAPRQDYNTNRTGPEVPETSLQLRDGSALAIEAALGVPAGMFSVNSGAMREGVRSFYHFTLLPIARLMEAELRLKLGVQDLRISLESLQAVDVSARSRAVGTLAQAGVPLAEALRLVGWTDVDLPDEDPNTFQV